MKYDIIKDDREALAHPCADVSLDDGNEIADILWKVLARYDDGIGLAANQVGINKKVAVIHIKDREPLVLINPKIIDYDTKIEFSYDGCLSFPGKEITTERYVWCTVETDNIGTIMFGPTTIGELTFNDPQLWESVAVQHEIDHLNGITMFDREIKKKPRKVEKKYGRNEKVTITDGTNQQTLKYKKAEKLLNEGWYIV